MHHLSDKLHVKLLVKVSPFQFHTANFVMQFRFNMSAHAHKGVPCQALLGQSRTRPDILGLTKFPERPPINSLELEI